MYGKVRGSSAYFCGRQEILNGIIDECSRYAASMLVEITHNQTPWKEAYRKGGYNNVIAVESIKNYFGED